MADLENLPEPHNPLGIDGIEFVEYATSEPLALGVILENLGFVPIARHRSREVMLYRQGAMNIIVNADSSSWIHTNHDNEQTTVLSAIALRVGDADFAYKRCINRGAWAIPIRAGAMELNIPGVHGAGNSIIYFVDRYSDFSIYDVDFKMLPNAVLAPPALVGLHFFGVVQAIQQDRTLEWVDFYRQLMGFSVLSEGHYFGILPKGTLLESPCHKFYIQLLEPPSGISEMQWDEDFIRLGLGAPDVLVATQTLKARGVVFVDRVPMLQPTEKGALTQLYKGGVSFELVLSQEQVSQ